MENHSPGWIVDGQQRFTALSELRGRDFEVLVSGFLCETEEELQKQFILVNNTRPLPKALVYELLPKVGDLPPRMSGRSQAALVTEALNYRAGSSLKGMIKQQTNPKGARCALAWSVETASLARQHNNAQLVGIGGRMHTVEEALSFVDAFLTTPWSKAERHQRRIDILAEYERTHQAPPVPGAAS